MTIIRTYIPGLLLLVSFAVLSLFTFKDYGISWDEPLTREMGYVYYDYVFKGDNKLVNYQERDHGSGFEIPLVCLEKVLHISDQPRAIFEMRHLVTHLFFLLAAFCGYMLFYRLFQKQSIACLGFLLLVLNPRLYAHSFFNSKDIPFASMFLISLAICKAAFSKNKLSWYLLLGLACGYTCSIRITGILLAAVIAGLLCIDIINALVQKEKPFAAFKNFSVFFISFCLSFVACWPTLWRHPVHNFIECYHLMSHFRWTGDVLFNGLKIPADKLPWFYLPEWLCISIPVSWLAAGIVGGIWVMEALFKKPLACIRNTPERFYLTCAGLFVLPLLLIIGMHSVVYDDWRHVYFIYVPFVILALFAINKLLEGKGKWAVHFLCALQVFLVASFMITSHPFQSVYFNELVSRNKEYLRDHFEMEYWACSHKQGLEYILAHDTSSVIRVTMYPIDQNLMMLSGKDRNRIVSAGLGEHPDYFMTTFRTHPGEYEYTDVFYEIKALNSTILRVYKLHK